MLNIIKNVIIILLFCFLLSCEEPPKLQGKIYTQDTQENAIIGFIHGKWKRQPGNNITLQGEILNFTDKPIPKITLLVKLLGQDSSYSHVNIVLGNDDFTNSREIHIDQAKDIAPQILPNEQRSIRIFDIPLPIHKFNVERMELTVLPAEYNDPSGTVQGDYLYREQQNILINLFTIGPSEIQSNVFFGGSISYFFIYPILLFITYICAGLVIDLLNSDEEKRGIRGNCISAVIAAIGVSLIQFIFHFIPMFALIGSFLQIGIIWFSFRINKFLDILLFIVFHFAMKYYIMINIL